MFDYITTPNLPSRRIRLAVIDGRAKSVGKTLSKMGVEVIYTRRHPVLYDAVSYHPDMVMHHLGGRDIVVAPDTDESFVYKLERHGFNVIAGKTFLSRNYPGDIAYNVARIGDIALHNTRYTDEVLKCELEKRGVRLIHVRQGYAKCSVCVVDERAIITQDAGIAKKASQCGIEVLLVPPGNIKLYELDYGFIGGATGLISKKCMGISGNISLYDHRKEVMNFLHKKGISIVNLGCDEIVDIGSIIPLME